MSESHHPSHGDHAKTDASDSPAQVGQPRLVANYTSGGHEVDYTPNRNLMAFLLIMLVLMIASAVGVYQLFVSHTEAQLSEAASAPATQLLEQRERERDIATSYGQVEREGQIVSYRVPYAEAKRMVLGDPARFEAAPPPPDWKHPDDPQ
jgi:hypothetical protein